MEEVAREMDSTRERESRSGSLPVADSRFTTELAASVPAHSVPASWCVVPSPSRTLPAGGGAACHPLS
jgi:hypothetical protein